MHTTFTSASAFRQEDSAWRQRPDWGGVLFDLGIHHFDLWRFLAGSEVEELFVHRRTDGPGHERATVSAVMANGVLVTSSFSHGVSDTNELEICGAKASLGLSCYRFDSLRVSENGAPRGAVRHWPGDAARRLRNVPQAIARLLDGGDVIDSYRAQWQSFVDAIRNDMPIKPGFEDGRSALQIALAAMESARTGRSVRVAEAADAVVPLAAAGPAITPGRLKVAAVIDQIERAANGQPTMSVVVITPDGYDTISTVLRHVHAQSVKDELEIVIVAPAVEAIPLHAPALQGF